MASDRRLQMICRLNEGLMHKVDLVWRAQNFPTRNEWIEHVLIAAVNASGRCHVEKREAKRVHRKYRWRSLETWQSQRVKTAARNRARRGARRSKSTSPRGRKKR